MSRSLTSTLTRFRNDYPIRESVESHENLLRISKRQFIFVRQARPPHGTVNTGIRGSWPGSPALPITRGQPRLG
ncbi:hypothetical protein GALMADRAFT_238734 [Galerina marginata CBS 339.88]|uniref:Uncharacterized protein n=1 Tax=Galerina marginata (strain CBS 339.88) TaxID=685588 RepID=A0A067S590_GALM3|nr:hypothetical protein GALMADRAFT_260352 [Galerina marginata CBS 339.88]KDR82985.1 hypothetical protein GALMADRAFT_238734 [Galerina marginata CBS 339.88]